MRDPEAYDTKDDEDQTDEDPVSGPSGVRCLCLCSIELGLVWWDGPKTCPESTVQTQMGLSTLEQCWQKDYSFCYRKKPPARSKY